jgi:toxin ParE1/3/4
LALRFVDAVQKTLKDLAASPGIGSPKSFHDSRLANVRSWWIKGFPNHLIFYYPIENGIMVLAIIHGSRDIERLLTQRT